VQACIPFYGVHDLLDGSGTRPLWPYLATHVLKADPAEAPELWALASPARLSVGAHPPFLVFHGALDSLVRPRHSRQLVDRLRRAGIAPIGYAELPGATHGFDALRSVRTIRAVDAVEAVLQALHARHRAGGIAGAWNEDGAGFGRNQ